MKKRLLFIGDNHIDDLKPVHRKDDYLEATLDELRESLEIAIDKKVDAAVLLGDLFNRINPSGEARNRTMAILKEFGDKGLWIICLRGNHDVAHSPDNYVYSALAACEINALIDTPCDPATNTAVIEELGLGIVHFSAKIAEGLKGGLMADAAVTILAAHCSITLGPYYKDFVTLEELDVNPKTRLVVAGHIHSPMRGRRDDGLMYIDPGSLCRRKVTTENLIRRPSVLLVDYELGGEIIHAEEVELMRPLGAADIFLTQLASDKKKRKEVQAESIKSLASLSGWIDDTEDPLQSLESSGLVRGIGPDAIGLVISTIQSIHQRRGEAA